MNKTIFQRSTGALLVTFLAIPLSVSAASDRSGRAGVSPEQKQALFQARKTWSQNSYNRRLELLQSNQRCVDAATTPTAIKTCRKQSKQAKSSIRNDRRAYINDMREQVGLPALDEKQRKMKRRKNQA